MFVIPAIAFIGGLAVMGRSKPETTARKLQCLGPRSGLVYGVEDFAEIGVIVVRAPGRRAIAQFVRRSVREPGAPGLIFQHGSGEPRLLELIRRDFAVEPQAPKAVPSPSRDAGSDGPAKPAPKASGSSTP